MALADLPAAEVWSNWVGNQSFMPGYAAAPRDEDELAALVRDASERGAGVRVAGARHSFTPIVETDGLLLDLSALRGVIEADRTRKRATALSAQIAGDRQARQQRSRGAREHVVGDEQRSRGGKHDRQLRTRDRSERERVRDQ